jgi:hypothetical protein
MPRSRRHIVTILLIGIFLSTTSSRCNRYPSPIAGAIAFLNSQQLPQDQDNSDPGVHFTDYAGNWPQSFAPRGRPDLRIRDASPFIPTFIHHALTLVGADTENRLDLRDRDRETATEMRIRAVDFLERFRAPESFPEAGTYGFWPIDETVGQSPTRLQNLALESFRGPQFFSTRRPVNMPPYPAELALPADADVTATVYAVLLDDYGYDGGAQPMDPASFFSDWRDTGAVPLRIRPSPEPSRSGAFLTWLDYRPAGENPQPNDVDVIVNANVLYALARYGRLDTPGVNETTALINNAIRSGRHRTRGDILSLYYPDNFMLHYAVTRAYHEGPVPDLAPAVTDLADYIRDTALAGANGEVYWDRGAPHLSTALAALALMNADRESDLVAGAITYLIAEQNPLHGGWKAGPFFEARTTAGPIFVWTSASLTTAFALEALIRYELADD